MIGNGLPMTHDQIFNQRQSLPGFIDHVISLTLVDVNDKFAHHLNSDDIAHRENLLRNQISRLRSMSGLTA